MVRAIWVQAALLMAWGILAGHTPVQAAFEISPIALCGFVSMLGARRVPREIAAVAGLLTCSAVVVHLMDGRTEAHFHFFVMVALLSLYEAWLPYLLAFGYVLIHHGVLGTLMPGAVFHDHYAMASPWRWAAVHALFIAALAIVHLSAWRLNEETRAATAESEERFRSAFDDAPTGMALVALDGTVLRANAALAAVAGVGSGRIIGRPLRDLVDDAPAGWPLDDDPAGGRELRFRTGALRRALWHHAAMRGSDGARTAVVSHCIDVTERRRAEEDLQWRAEHDALTGLPNRRLLTHRLGAALRAAEPVAVIVIDVDQLNVVNDSLGHGAGDQVLRTVAARLAGLVRPGDLLARLGGDDFGLIVSGTVREDAALGVARRIEQALAAPLDVDGRQVYVTASLGIRLPDGLDIDADAVLRDADAALHRSAEGGAGAIAVFDRSMHRSVRDRLEIERGLRAALQDEQLHLAYQPVVRLGDGRAVGVEALLRWTHPERGPVPPDQFVPVAEQNGTILAIGEWALNAACREVASWGGDVGVAVNVSARQLVSSRLVDAVARALDASGLAPGRLCLEVTETAVLSDPVATAATLAGLKALGVHLAVDDFGTGTGSLHQLRTLLPVDILKIDRSFVSGIAVDDHDAGIVEGVIGLGHSLGLSVVAEGVETDEQAGLLREWGCQHGQGYVFARPMPAAQAREWLVARAAALSEVPSRP